MNKGLLHGPVTAWAWVLGLLAMGLPVAWAQDVPFVGIVDQDNVEVRAGAGRTFYVVGTLRAGQRVQVDKIIFGWHQIVAPDGTYSYVSKAFVDAKGDGKTGVVNADRTAVKAAATTGPGDSYRRQVDLMRGDTVEIVGEEGGFYKIRPPANAFVYVAPGTIRRATAAELAAATGRPDPSPAPVSPDRPIPEARQNDTALQPATPDPSVQEMIQKSPPLASGDEPVQAPSTAAPPASPQLPPSADRSSPPSAADPQRVATLAAADAAFEIQPNTEQVRQLDAKMKASMELPLEQQPIEELLAGYRAAQLDPSLPPLDREIVKFRIATLQRNKNLADGLKQIRAAKQQVETSRSTETPVEQLEGPVTYAAVGQLLASSVYDGVTLPRMYRIVAPGGGRTLAYIQPNQVKNIGAVLGRIVGVVGPMRFDPGLKANVIEARRIDVLEKATAPTPPPGTIVEQAASDAARASNPAADLDMPENIDTIAPPQPVMVEGPLNGQPDPGK